MQAKLFPNANQFFFIIYLFFWPEHNQTIIIVMKKKRKEENCGRLWLRDRASVLLFEGCWSSPCMAATAISI